MVYLDHNSTTPLDHHVAEAMLRAAREFPANPASQHTPGQAARRRLELARRNILNALGANLSGLHSDRLIFTSGGTEANNLAILGLVPESQPRILISTIEHPSVVAAAAAARAAGIDVQTIPVNRHGVIRLDVLPDLLKTPTGLVSVMLANNETGAIQPVAEAAALAARAGALFHVDAVQAVGKISVSFEQLRVDALTFAPHKFHGPRSIGGLVVKAGVPLQPFLHGGVQQWGLRPGTEDVALAVGCETALALAVESLAERAKFLQSLRDRFVEILSLTGCGPFFVNAGQAPRLPNTLNLSFPGVERQALLLAGDVAGLAFSTGSACASGSSEPSPVLLAMGLDREQVESSIRLSFGMTNTLEEIEWAANCLGEIVRGFRYDGS